MSSEKEPQGHSSLSIQTLVISSLAAVAAAIVVPMFWARGSLLATAITPIIVAIVSEALNRPAKVITSVTPKVTRRSATGAALRSEQPAGVGARGEGPEQVHGQLMRLRGCDPALVVRRLENQGHAVVEGLQQFVGIGGDHGVREERLAGFLVFPHVKHAAERKQRPVF